MFAALTALATRRARTVAVAALAGTILAGALGVGVADRLAPYDATDAKTQSARADALLRHAGVSAGVDVIALVRTPQGARGPAGRARIAQVARTLGAQPDIGRVIAYPQGGAGLLARDGRSAQVLASLKPGIDDNDAGKRLQHRLGHLPGVTLGGFTIASPQLNSQVSDDLRRAELLAFPLLFLLSFLFFRSLVSALLPVLVGGTAIVLTFVGLRLASEVGTISVFALNLVTGMGLGLAIDYSLFMVFRFREELEQVDRGEAIRRTLATSGRTVLFSSVTVAAAMGSLLVFPQRFLYSMGVGGMMVALIAGGVALLVLPAVLYLLGSRVNAFAPARLQRAAHRDARPATAGFWYRLSRAVMRRPAAIAIAATVALLTLGAPFTRIAFTSFDASVLPTDRSARQVQDVLDRDYDISRTEPITVVARTTDRAAVLRYAADLRRLPGVRAVQPPRPGGSSLTLVDLTSRTAAFANGSLDLVKRIRALEPPFPALVRGRSADFVDLKHSLADHLPIALSILIATTLVALFLMTGSVVLPIKALVMNALTVSAAFGLLVLIFQDGRFEQLLGYSSQGALESTQPVFLFAIAFGLSTDYGVFLLSRIKEARDRGASDREAVAIGLERTGRIVSAAAVLFCVAIGAFSTSEVIFVKELGIGTALAVLIDASIVRALLVPSLMELLGSRNWWSPRPLRRLHQRIGLSEA